MIQGQIGILKVATPIPLVQERESVGYGIIEHHMLIKPGIYPLWAQDLPGQEVYSSPDVLTERVVRRDGRVEITCYGIPTHGFTVITWSAHEVAASVLRAWAIPGAGHPVWDFALDMASIRPEWEYCASTVMVDDNHSMALEYRRGVLLPPL